MCIRDSLYPADPFQALLCDEVAYVVEDAGVKMGPTFRMTGEAQKPPPNPVALTRGWLNLLRWELMTFWRCDPIRG